uniref:Olfactory receptor n=2 Tax=Vombatus ursinus TaxID=29139 RepID=A0A4X2LWU3_VOMUR
MMQKSNETRVEEFILEGFPAVQHLGTLLFAIHLVLYLISMTGNTVIVILTWIDHRLQVPMYFFLSNFSLLEGCCITTIIPKLLTIFFSGAQTISFAACLTQFFFFIFWASTGLFLLSILSLDRYIAICNPLHYHSIMNKRACILLVVSCYILGFILVFSLTLKMSALSFCGPNNIHHFFCDLGPLTHVSCSDASEVESLGLFFAMLIVLSSLVISVISYINIVKTIAHLPSAKERQKAFSTCSSHLIVLSVTYGSSIFMYVIPKQGNRLDTHGELVLVNTVATPVLNPFIYTLRNKQVKQAFRDALYKIKLSR